MAKPLAFTDRFVPTLVDVKVAAALAADRVTVSLPKIPLRVSAEVFNVAALVPSYGFEFALTPTIESGAGVILALRLEIGSSV